MASLYNLEFGYWLLGSGRRDRYLIERGDDAFRCIHDLFERNGRGGLINGAFLGSVIHRRGMAWYHCRPAGPAVLGGGIALFDGMQERRLGDETSLLRHCTYDCGIRSQKKVQIIRNIRSGVR